MAHPGPITGGTVLITHLHVCTSLRKKNKEAAKQSGGLFHCSHESESEKGKKKTMTERKDANQFSQNRRRLEELRKKKRGFHKEDGRKGEKKNSASGRTGQKLKCFISSNVK